MAFPVIEGANSGFEADTTTPTFNLPASIAAGELLLLFVASDNFSGTGAPTVSGFTELFSVAVNSDADRFTAFAKVATGSEGATVSGTFGLAEGSSHISYRISGWYGTIADGVDAATASNTTGTTGNPPNNIATWDTDDYLWIAVCGWYPGNISLSSYPTNYTLSQTTNRYNSSQGAGIAAAGRQLNAATEDPDVFTNNLSCAHGMATIAIRPAAAGGSGPERPVLEKIKGRMRGFLKVTPLAGLSPLAYRSYVNFALEIGGNPTSPSELTMMTSRDL